MAKGEREKLNKKDRSKMRGAWLTLTAFFSLSIAGIILSILCLSNTTMAFVVKYNMLCRVLSILFFLGLCIAAIWLAILRKDVAVKMLFTIYFLLLFALSLVLIFQKTGFFDLISTSDGLQAYIERAGIWMPLLYILLQYFQVIILPIPSIVSTVAGVAIFGAFKTMIFSLTGILLGSFTAFFIGRKLGNKAVVWIVGEEILEKWQKKLKGKDNLVLTIMFILPLFPDDILCFVAGLSSMSNRYFITMTTITRAIGITATCYSFDFIPWNTWWGLLIWAALILGVITVFILVYKKMDSLQAFYKKLRKNQKNSTK